MKHYLLAGLLLAAVPTLAQTAPPKNAVSIVVHTPDSARVAYSKVVRELLSSGYGIDRKDNETFFISTAPKSSDGVLRIKLQAVTMPETGGAATTFRATFFVLNAATLAAHMEEREMPVRYTGPGSNPMKRTWAELARVAAASLPAGRVEYKQ